MDRRGWTGLRRVAAAIRRRWAWLVSGVGVLLVAALAVVVTAFPSLASTACPGCYGLEELSPGVYAEPGLSAEQRRQVTDAVETAGRRIDDYFGVRTSVPRVLACLSEDCYRRIGGGKERGVAVLNRAVMLSPRGVDSVIATHELSHVEFHQRLGSARDQVPQWFDEGLAVLVSDDPRYLEPPTAVNRCKVSTDEALPVTLDEWLRAASADEHTYAKSACRVNRWVEANGGRTAVLRLIERLVAGEKFTAVVPG